MSGQYQDFKPVAIYRSNKPTGNREKEVTEARRTGDDVETKKKFNAGTNRQHSAVANPVVVERKEKDDEEDLTVPKLDRDMALKIQQARTAKGWTQKDLAQRIAERANIINDYECGRAIPNQQIIGKLERALGVKLRGQSS